MNVLEVGCGALRVGVRLVDYQDAGRYYGIDGVEESLEVGYSVELASAGMTDKRRGAARDGRRVSLRPAPDE
jgi:hypothetical protein